MTFSVVEYDTAGIGDVGGGSSTDSVTFSYSGLSNGDIVIMAAAGPSFGFGADWEFNSPDTLGVYGPSGTLDGTAPFAGVGVKVLYYQPFSGEPSSGIIKATGISSNVLGVSYWIIHSDTGLDGWDFIGADVGDFDADSYQNLAGPLSGSFGLSIGRAAAYGGTQVQLAAGGGWTYRPSSGAANPGTFTSPSGSSTQASQQLAGVADYATGLAGYDINAPGSSPSLSSTWAWSQPSGGGGFPNNVGTVAVLAGPTVYVADRYAVAVHKTILPNIDSYYGPASLSDFSVEIVDNTPSGSPYFGPRFLVPFGGDGDTVYIPDNDVYGGLIIPDNAGASWPGLESAVTNYDLTNIYGTGGVSVNWTSGSSFTVDISGDGDLYLENTFTGATPTPGGDYWGIRSTDA